MSSKPTTKQLKKMLQISQHFFKKTKISTNNFYNHKESSNYNQEKLTQKKVSKNLTNKKFGL